MTKWSSQTQSYYDQIQISLNKQKTIYKLKPKIREKYTKIVFCPISLLKLGIFHLYFFFIITATLFCDGKK